MVSRDSREMSTAQTSPVSADELHASAEELHAVLWERLVDERTGILLDYAAPDGSVEIPSPEECRARRPNALSWWTPIENGAFFNGLYLDALCTKWALYSAEETRTEIRTLVRGLLLLQDVGERTGFIARGISTDGGTHYPLGSSDQTFPWLYGLWKYLRSGVPNEAERTDIVGRMDTVVREAKALGWHMPAEEPYAHAGDWCSECFREVARLVFANRIMLELTGEEFWQDSFQQVLEYTFGDGMNTLGFLAADAADLPFHYTWINASSVAAVRELYRLEQAPEAKAVYRECLRQAGRSAVEYVPRFRDFRHGNARFSGNWRCMNPMWREQQTVEEAVKLAAEQLQVWSEECPAIARDKRHMMYPLFAAWIVLLSEDEELIDAALNDIKKALVSYDWESLSYSVRRDG